MIKGNKKPLYLFKQSPPSKKNVHHTFCKPLSSSGELKLLVPYFKTLPGFNAYDIELLISVIKNNVSLSESEAHRCMWASTANWKGGVGKNIEIDLLQENRNKDFKKSIKTMDPNKTDKVVDRAGRASVGERYTAQNFDHQVGKTNRSSSHSHKSPEIDEGVE